MKFIKKTASVVASLIIILALGGFFFVKNFDLNRYKPQIVDIVYNATGRNLYINGDAELGLSLIPTLVVNDVSFANPEWAMNPDLLRLEKLEIKFAIMPLLQKRVEIDKLILIKPEVYLEVSKQGEKSWVFGTAEHEGGKTSVVDSGKKVKDASAALGIGLVADEVRIENGIVNYYDAQIGANKQLTINSVEMEIPSENEEIVLDIDALFDGREVIAKVKANTLNSLLNDGKADFAADVRALGIKSVLNGVVEGIFEMPLYALEGNVYNPAGNFELPETTMEFRIDGNLQQAEVDLKSLNVATNMVTGKIKADWSLPKLFVDANLNAGVFNVNKLAKTSVLSFEMPKFVSEANALEMVPNDEVPFRYLNMVDALLNLKAQQIILADEFTLKDVDLRANLKDGVLNVGKLDMKIDDGSVDIKALANAKNSSIKFELQSNNLQLDDLYAKFKNGKDGSMQILSGGNFDVDINLTANGNTYRKLSENLTGQVIAIVDKSTIKIGKIEWLYSNVIEQLLKILKLDKARNENMELLCAVIRADLKSGKAVFPNGIAINSPQLKVVSSGNINLVNDKIDFTIAPSLNKLADGNITQALASFIKIVGTINSPKIKLDQSSAISTIVGTMATGGLYLGSEILLNEDVDVCHSALAGTKFANKFQTTSGVKATTKKVYHDVSQDTKAAVKELKNAAKDFLGALMEKNK